MAGCWASLLPAAYAAAQPTLAAAGGMVAYGTLPVYGVAGYGAYGVGLPTFGVPVAGYGAVPVYGMVGSGGGTAGGLAAGVAGGMASGMAGFGVAAGAASYGSPAATGYDTGAAAYGSAGVVPGYALAGAGYSTPSGYVVGRLAAGDPLRG